MTTDKDLKRLIRKRAARTGESYAAARRSFLAKGSRGDAPDTTREMWLTRASQGYSGKGSAKPTGYEHAVVTITGRGISVAADVAFKNYGVHSYRVESDGAARRSRYDYADGRTIVEAAVRGSSWEGEVTHEGTAEAFVLTVDAATADLLPSYVARFLPMALPRQTGELAAYLPLPEDAFPAWRPPGKGSWFPVMGVARHSLIDRRVIVGVGDEAVGRGRAAVRGFRYDHIAGDGSVRATTWVGETGDVVAYEQLGCVLRAVTPEDAQRLDPRGRRS